MGPERIALDVFVSRSVVKQSKHTSKLHDWLSLSPTIPNNTCCLASASSLFPELPCFKKFAFLASSIIVLDCHLHWLYIRGNHKPNNKFQSFRLFIPLGLSDVCMTRGNSLI